MSYFIVYCSPTAVIYVVEIESNIYNIFCSLWETLDWDLKRNSNIFAQRRLLQCKNFLLRNSIAKLPGKESQEMMLGETKTYAQISK